MPLYSPEGKRMWGIPEKRKPDYERWRGELGEGELEAVFAELNRKIDDQRVVYSSRLGARCLSEAVFAPVKNAAGDHADLFFGLLLWDVMSKRKENWYFTHDSKGTDGQKRGKIYAKQ